MLRECPRCDELVVLDGDGTRCDSCGALVPMDDDWSAADTAIYEIEEE